MKNTVLVCNNDFISRLRMKILAVLAAAAALFLSACYDPLADLELVNIDGEEIRKVLHESAYAYLAGDRLSA